MKRSPWKRRFLLKTIIFRFHVKFRGSTLSGKHITIDPQTLSSQKERIVVVQHIIFQGRAVKLPAYTQKYHPIFARHFWFGWRFFKAAGSQCLFNLYKKSGQSWGVVRTLGKALLWKPHSTKERGKESREARNQTDGLQLMFFIAWESHKQKAVVAWRRYNMWIYAWRITLR